ncbi:MAG TPA: 4'-phosphopantetheinyl transferase superfamily protein [Candidatus Angelobacter sp.]|nr:4'-phosphopantetheinyl transferase superfamily protein [Candidatus Angelobacter sp.]
MTRSPDHPIPIPPDHPASTWPAEPKSCFLQPGEVHIWRVSLAQPEPVVARCRELLPPAEIARANRFYFERDRRRFLVSHGMVRTVLGRYLALKPLELRFGEGPKGKPDLVPEQNPLGLTFNLSHSGEFALMGVASKLIMGIDIEVIRVDFGGQEIAERFFSPYEVATLLSLPQDQRAEAFFYCWTRKEAYIKAQGEGLSLPLDSFDVTFAPGTEPALLRVADHPNEVARWKLYDIDVGPGYKAALMIEGKQHHLRYFDWQGPSPHSLAEPQPKSHHGDIA